MKVQIPLVTEASSGDEYDQRSRVFKQIKSNALHVARQLRGEGYKKVKVHPPSHEEDGEITFDVPGHRKDSLSIQMLLNGKMILVESRPNGKMKFHGEAGHWEALLEQIQTVTQ